MIRAFSFGGGVQSTAVLVMAAQGRITYDVFLFANVGDDSESPETLAYMRDFALPYAAANGVRIKTVAQPRETLIANAERLNNPLPTYTVEGAPFRRNCTKHVRHRLLHDLAVLRGGGSVAPFHPKEVRTKWQDDRRSPTSAYRATSTITSSRTPRSPT